MATKIKAYTKLTSLPLLAQETLDVGCYPPRMLMSERPEFYSSRLIADPFTFWFKPVSLFWLGRIYDGSDTPSVAFAVGA
jgi:hypothetical protein